MKCSAPAESEAGQKDTLKASPSTPGYFAIQVPDESLEAPSPTAEETVSSQCARLFTSS